eukprot:Anaeramoba_ignava/a580_12.p1 GENE.a580_12~~a580_12.p1  ORF type:complete len:203 (+),score=1.84 a580_12:74-682(+)
MLYICSKLDKIQNFWSKEFEKNYDLKIVNSDFFDFNKNFESDDVLILDLDQFLKVEESITFFNSLPKTLKVIAIIEEPKLAHGTYIIKKGFKSYLSKKTSKFIVDQVLRTVAEGNVWLYPELMSYIIKHVNLNSEQKNTSNLLAKLSSKEQEVANLVAEGLSNKEISSKLDIQLVTVKKHISSIFTKLNVKDRVSLAILINK